jgi:hypothetical protein
MAATNFLQHNNGELNQEPDATYLTDTTRTGGIVVDQIIASPWLNKVLYQSSTFVTAFAQMLVTKGYSPVDANLAALVAVLGNVITNKDLATLNYLTIAAFNAAKPFAASIGGTGATSLAGAKILNRIAQADPSVASGPITSTVLIASIPAAGRYTVKWNAYAAGGGLPSGLTVTVTWTQAGSPHMVNNFNSIGSTDGTVSTGVLPIYPDSGTAVTFAQTQSFSNAYQLHIWLVEE